MGMIEVKKDFSRRELLWFGPLFAIFFGIIGWILIQKWAAYQAAYGLWAVTAGLILLYYSIPPLRRPVYRAWIYAVLPIGWVVSHLLLATIYYFLLTPIGILMRLFGYDPLQRKFDRSRKSYWVARETKRDPASYFKQY
jgi:hypothetical protein